MIRHDVLPERRTRGGGIVFDRPRRRWPAALAGCGVTLALFAWWPFGTDGPPESMPAGKTIVGQRLATEVSPFSIDVGGPAAPRQEPTAPVAPQQAETAPVADRYNPLDQVATFGVPIASVPPEVAAALSRPSEVPSAVPPGSVGSDPPLQN